MRNCVDLPSVNPDTEMLESAFEEACGYPIGIEHRLELRKITLTLLYATNRRGIDQGHSNFVELHQILANFKANLQRRKKASDSLTSSRLMDLPEPARTILLSDIAYIFRDDIDDYTQIDFGNAKHVKLLQAAVDSSIRKITNKQGRPMNEALDEFFIGLKNLYESATGKPAIAGAHFDSEPKTDFEKLMYLGYQIIRPAQAYPSALKAYERAIARST